MKKWFLAVLPPEVISTEIIAIQQELKQLHGFLHALKTPPHITIIPPFKATIEQVDSFCSKFSSEVFLPFTVELNGFEAFHPRVIFVDVALNQALNSFAKQAKALFANEKIVANKGEKHSFTPHITIANRDLNNKKFKEIFPAFESREYHAFFNVSSICLLVHENGIWKKQRSIPFLN